MNLQDLYYCISITEDVKVIDREFSAYGMEYAIVGLVNTNDRTELVLLEFDEHKADNDCCAESEDMIYRELVLSGKDIHKGLSDLLKEIVIGDYAFDVVGSQGCALDCGLDSGLYVLAEFMKQGWKSEKFFDYPPDCVFVNFMELDKKIEHLAQLDLLQPIKLKAFETTDEEFPLIKLSLPVEQDIDKTVPLFGGNEKICIKRVHLADLSEDDSIDDEHLSMICPNGMRLPVIEYTYSNDELCFDISLSSYLDSLYSDNYNCFATDDGVFGIVVGIQLDNYKKGTKSFTIQQAVKADTKKIECEIVHCTKEIKNPQIEEFLI